MIIFIANIILNIKVNKYIIRLTLQVCIISDSEACNLAILNCIS